MELDSNKLLLSWDQIPTMGNLYTIVKELDEMLLENSNELEQCMSNIMECINDIPPVGKPSMMSGGTGSSGKSSSAKSNSSQYDTYDHAIQMLINGDVLEKNACFVPSQEDVRRVLQHVLDAINKNHLSPPVQSLSSGATAVQFNSDCEQQLFLTLVRLSTHEGFCLPLKPQNSSSLSAQDPTVSSLMDTDEKNNALLWQQICKKFETAFVNSLQHNLPIAVKSPVRNQLQKRHFLLEALTMLFPINNVWNKYTSIRMQDLHKLCNQVFHLNLNKSPAIKVHRTQLDDVAESTQAASFSTQSENAQFNLTNFVKLMPNFFSKLKVMVEEDEFVVLSDIFNCKVSLTDVYTHIYLPFMEVLLNKVCEKISNQLQQGTSVFGGVMDNVVNLDDKKSSSKLKMMSSNFDRKEQQTQTQSAFGEFSSFMDTSENNDSNSPAANTMTLDVFRLVCEMTKQTMMFEDFLTDRAMQLKLDNITDKEASPKLVKSVLKNRNPDLTEPSTPANTPANPSISEQRNDANVDTQSDFGMLGNIDSPELGSKYLHPMSATSMSITSTYGSQRGQNQSFNPAAVVEDFDMGRYLWIRVILNHLESSLSRALKLQLSGSAHKSLEDLKTSFDANSSCKSTSVCCDFNFTLNSQPKRIPYHVKSILEMYNWCLPLLKVCLSVEPIYSAFLDSMITSLKALISELGRQCNLVPENASLDQMYLAFSAAYSVHSFTNHITRSLGEIQLPVKFRSNFTLLQKQYSEFCQMLLEKMKTFHETSLCAMMQDAESNNYSSLRASHTLGDVPVSNTVKAWMHLTRHQLIQDTFKVLPADVATRLCAYVLNKSVEKWLLRFSSVKPSPARVSQVRNDILAILVHTSCLLFVCTKSVKNLLFDESWLLLSSEQDDIHAIHSSCNSLLSILLILTSPLHSLHNALIIHNYPMVPPIQQQQAPPFNHSQSQMSMDPSMCADQFGNSLSGACVNEGYLIQWMKIIHATDCAPPQSQSAEERTNKSANQVKFRFTKRPITPFDLERPECMVALTSRLSVSSESINPVTLLTSFLLHDCMLPKMVLRQAPNFNVCNDHSSSQHHQQQRRLFASYPSVSCQGLFCVSDTCSQANAFPLIDLLRPFVTVLNSLGYICPNALSDTLLPIMHEAGDVDSFLVGQPLKTTGWANIYLLLSPIVRELLQRSLLCLFESPSSSVSPVDLGVSMPFYDSLGELPCGCRLRHRNNSTGSGSRLTTGICGHSNSVSSTLHPSSSLSYSDRVQEAMSEYMSLLSTAIYSLSPSLISFFTNLGNLCSESNLTIPNDSLLLYVITRCSIHYMKNNNYLQDEVQVGILKKKEMKLMKKFKDALKLLFCTSDDKSHSSEHSHWCAGLRPQVDSLAQKLNRFVRNSSKGTANSSEKNFLDDIPISLLEDQVLNGCQLVASSPEGRISLIQVHHIIKNNIDWVENELLQTGVQTNNTRRFEIPTMPVSGPIMSNDVDAYFQNHQSLSLNWDSLFSADLGVSKLALKRLVVNRPEFQDEQSLLTVGNKMYAQKENMDSQDTSLADSQDSHLAEQNSMVLQIRQVLHL